MEFDNQGNNIMNNYIRCMWMHLESFGSSWIIKKWWLEVRPSAVTSFLPSFLHLLQPGHWNSFAAAPTATCDEVCCVNLGQPGQDSAGWIWVEGFEKMGLRTDMKGFAADRGSLELDSRVLGDLVLPLIVWYMFSIIYSLSILSIKVGGLGIY